MCKKRMSAQMCFVVCMVAVAAIVAFSAVEAKAALLLTDDFTATGTPDPTDLNYNLAARQAGSAVGTVTLYDQQGSNEVGNTDFAANGSPYDTGDFLLVEGGWGVVGLEHNFATEANVGDSPLTIEFDMSPVISSGSWTALDVGPYAPGFGDFVSGAVSLGIAFELNGMAEVRSPGNVAHGKTDLGVTLAPGELGHYVVTISGQSGSGSGFSSNGFQVTAQLNGGAVTTLYSSATALPSGGLSFCGQQGAVDNLSVSADVIPEPGTFALLAAALLGLAAYAWRKRK